MNGLRLWLLLSRKLSRRPELRKSERTCLPGVAKECCLEAFEYLQTSNSTLLKPLVGHFSIISLGSLTARMRPSTTAGTIGRSTRRVMLLAKPCEAVNENNVFTA